MILTIIASTMNFLSAFSSSKGLASNLFSGSRLNTSNKLEEWVKD